MPLPLHVRPAAIDDLEQIHEVWYAAEWGGDPAAPPLRRLRWYEHLVETGEVVVAKQAGRVIGFAGAIRRSNSLALADLFVDPDMQSKGVGGRLLDALLSGHLPRMTLASTDHRAVPLYVKHRMVPRWPNLYLKGTDVEPSAVATVEQIDPTAPLVSAVDEAVGWSHRQVDRSWWTNDIGARHLAVVRNGNPLGYAVVTPATPDSLRSPEAAAVVATASLQPADADSVVLAAASAATGLSPVTWLTVPAPHPALPLLLAAGYRITDTDTFCAEAEGMIDPTRITLSPDLI